MKRYAGFLTVITLAFTLHSCELLSSLTNSDVVAGLKEALTVSTDTSTTKLSRPIFKNAITNITFNDAVNILHGADDAATQYLKTQTYTQLNGAFKPHIETALTTVGAQQTWNTVTTTYNTYNDILGLQDINDDLADHTTNKALDGLFHVVAIEEGKIRNDINHRVSELLQQVFGN